jgi:hypothetical protein
MSEQKSALNALWAQAAKSGKYVQTSSFSCVHKFSQSFPKQENPTFKEDNLDSTYNGKIFGSARRT